MQSPEGSKRSRNRILGWLRVVTALAVLYAGWRAYRHFAEVSVLRTHSSLMKLLIAGDFEGGYRLTTDEYRAGHSVEQFRQDFFYIEGDDYYEPAHPHVLSFWVFRAEVCVHERPGFLELLNSESFFYKHERGGWRFTGRTEVYLD